MTSQTKRRRVEVANESAIVDGGGGWTDEHQVLLQYLMHARIVKKLDLGHLHGRLFNSQESLKDSLEKITNQINPLKMDIKQIKCDVTGETNFVLYHTTGESFFTRCSPYNKGQLEFLKEILKSMVLSESGKMGKIDLLNYCENMSKSDADEALDLFVKAKLLTVLPNTGYCLSPLSVVEFAPFYNSCFGENLQMCDLCKQIVFVGKKCGQCKVKFHYHCVRTWMKRCSECPKCQTNWAADEETE